MDNSLALFQFQSKSVRVVIQDGEPWFVARDLCDVLDLVNVTRSLSRLDEDEKGFHTVNTLGGAQQLAIVNESGMYSLVLTSRKEEAKAFKRWITSEVLPQIRKTGSYGARKPFDGFPEWIKRLQLFKAKTKIPVGYFCIFMATADLLSDFEGAGYCLPNGSVPDISIGKTFCSFLKQTGKYDAALIRSYPHHYPDGRVVSANIYHNSLWPIFQEWFAITYRIDKLPAYLAKKDPRAAEVLSKLLVSYKDERQKYLGGL